MISSKIEDLIKELENLNKIDNKEKPLRQLTQLRSDLETFRENLNSLMEKVVGGIVFFTED